MIHEKTRTASVRVEAQTLQEALAKAAEQLGVGLSVLDYQVEQRGARGILGIGRKPFVVSASVAIGDIRSRVTKSGVFLRVAPPMTLEQAERALATRGISLDRPTLGRVLAAPDDTWFRVGDSDPAVAEAVATVTISADEMTAIFEMSAPPEGGRTFEVEDVLKLLGERGVVRGIRDEAIVDALENERFAEPILVAQGEPPKNGVDAMIRYFFRTDKSHVNLVEDDRGHIDFHELGLFEDVSCGQVLAESVSSTRAGNSGWTVTGRTVPARDGTGEVKLQAGKNTLLSEDGRTLTAKIAGQVLFASDVVTVEAVQEIKGNVDFTTGNIDSRGSVIVRGDIATGFRVRADGNLDVHGLVDGAELAAKGDVVIRKGVLGKGVGTIDAGGDVFAKFADRVTIRAGRDAIIGGEILTSEVAAGRRIKCEGLRGSIIGGHVSAAESVTAATIGSRLGVETSVTAGTAVVGTKVVFAGVRLTINGAALEVVDTERASRFVEAEGAVVRSAG